MYIDLVVLIILLLIVLFFFRRWSNFVYAVAIIDIFLRILNFLGNNIPVPEFKALINKYFPDSVPHIIDKYSSGIIETIFMWFLLVIYVCFLSYIFRTFLKKRR